jgi:hypothetical protein
LAAGGLDATWDITRRLIEFSLPRGIICAKAGATLAAAIHKAAAQSRFRPDPVTNCIWSFFLVSERTMVQQRWSDDRLGAAGRFRTEL